MRPQPIRDVQIVRRINRGAVLELLRRAGPMPRTAIAKATRLTAPTCFSIVDELVAADLARWVATSRSSPGRPRAIFEFNPGAAFSIGVDLSGSYFVGVLIDLAGRVLETRRAPRPDPPGVATVVSWISEFAAEMCRTQPEACSRLSGVGIAVPGLLAMDSESVVRSTNLNWGEVHLARLVAEAVDTEVHLENTARSVALCERWFGAGQDADHMICVNIGMGIGMGMIVDGKIHLGPYAHSGELGHTIVQVGGPPCRCGRLGCLEAVAAGGAILRDVLDALGRGTPSVLLDRSGGTLSSVTPEMVAEAADDGDGLAREVVLNAGLRIGLAIANAVTLLNPTLVVLSGFLVHSSRFLCDTIADTISRQVLESPNRNVQVPVVRAKMGPRAAAVGAGGVVHQRRMGMYDGVHLEVS